MVHFSDIAIEKMNVHLSKTDYSNVFIIVDENTHEHCLPLFLPKVETDAAIEIIGSTDTPAIPLNSSLESELLPNAEKIKNAIQLLLNY